MNTDSITLYEIPYQLASDVTLQLTLPHQYHTHMHIYVHFTQFQLELEVPPAAKNNLLK